MEVFCLDFDLFSFDISVTVWFPVSCDSSVPSLSQSFFSWDTSRWIRVIRSGREEELSFVKFQVSYCPLLMPVQNKLEQEQHHNRSGEGLDFTACWSEMNLSTLEAISSFSSCCLCSWWRERDNCNCLILTNQPAINEMLMCVCF